MPDLSWESAALGGINGCTVSGDYFVAFGGTAAPVTLVGDMDEVGRGVLVDPVCIGVIAVSAMELAAEFPPGLNDSKALTARQREALIQPTQSWVKDFAIGEATNMEVDEMGIMAAMCLAEWRALNQLDARGHLPQELLLDGNVDYLQAEHQANLFDARWHLMNSAQPAQLARPTQPAQPVQPVQPTQPAQPAQPAQPVQPAQPAQPAMGATPAHNPPPAPLLKVQTLVKADQHVATVAGAAVLAKVYRDASMSRLEDPDHGWGHNVGYGTKAHREAISRLGPSRWHHHTWKLNWKPVTLIQRLTTRICKVTDLREGALMVNNEDIESYESGLELELYREYRDVISLFNYVVGTDRRFYLANKVNVTTHNSTDGDVFSEIGLGNAWVWDVYRSSCFVQSMRALSFKDINVEELSKPEIEILS